jgi:hypothetical protein
MRNYWKNTIKWLGRAWNMRKTDIEAPVLAADTLQRTQQPTVQRFKNALQLTSHASRSALLKLKF